MWPRRPQPPTSPCLGPSAFRLLSIGLDAPSHRFLNCSDVTCGLTACHHIARTQLLSTWLMTTLANACLGMCLNGMYGLETLAYKTRKLQLAVTKDFGELFGYPNLQVKLRQDLYVLTRHQRVVINKLRAQIPEAKNSDARNA
ncbi:hypothetical protein DYB31_015212, partial [Aphanomyces astaci]